MFRVDVIVHDVCSEHGRFRNPLRANKKLTQVLLKTRVSSLGRFFSSSTARLQHNGAVHDFPVANPFVRVEKR